MSKVLMCAGLFAAVFACRAATWYVDCQMDDYANHDGSSWSLAYKTIQEAVNAAAANDTIYVAEGHYNEGGDDGGGNDFNRVYLNKNNLKLLAVGDRGKTFIEGARSPEPVDDYGNGHGAVRCIRSTANECVISNFTLTGGATYITSAGENGDYANGGAFRGLGKGSTSSLVDCVVTNCTGVRGGAFYYGRAVRTLFVDNTCAWKGAAGYNSTFYNCIVTRHSGRSGGACFVACSVVNCTVSRLNTSYVGTEGALFRNTVAVLHPDSFGDAADTGLLVLQNSVCCKGVNNKGKSFFSLIENSVTNAVNEQLENPVFDDFRLMPDSPAVGCGDAQWLAAENIALPDGVARYVDFMGAPIPETGTINAGAVQTVGPAPKGGRLVFTDNRASVDGHGCYAYNEYVQAVDAYPTQFLVKGWASNGSRFYGFKRTTSHTLRLSYVFPRAEDDTIYMMPPRAGETYTNTAAFAATGMYLHVNPETGVDTMEDNQGQSPDKPFKTIQYALNVAATNVNNNVVISCAAGDYNSEDNLKDHKGVTNRVTIAVNQKVRIIGAGAGRSIIWGKKEATGDDDIYKGGPNAIRCVACLTGWSSAIQGFTFKEGRNAFNGTNNVDSAVEKGGGAYCSEAANSQFYITDCTFDDCVGYRGALFGGIAQRCRFTNCIGYNGGIRYAQVVCSLIENCPYDGANGIMMSYNASFRHITAVGRTNTDRVCAGGTAVLTNSVLHTFKTLDSAWTPVGAGVYVGDVGGGTSLRTTDRDPQLVDPANGDYRLYSSSPAFGGGVDNSDYADYYSPDLNGNPIRFVNGRPTAGAIQDFALGYGAFAANGVTSPETGVRPLAPGETATITLDVSGATRPLTAIRVNGEDLPYDGTLSWTFTAPADGVVTGPLGGVEPIFSTNWYVNANAPDNSGDGFSPATAMKAFHGENGLLTRYTMLAGDVIHAAKGVYNEGRGEVVTSGVKHYSRVVVPGNVTLVADDGPEETFVVGANATTNPDAKGRGEDAMRCVYLYPDTRLRGFTLTGGRTQLGDLGDGFPRNGGGVCCGISGNASTVLVEDCIISNNAAVRGGGMANGIAIRCRFFDNWAAKNRAALSYGFAYNCVFNHNRGQNTSQNTYGLFNCTFGEDCKEENGKETQASGLAYGPVINCIFLGKVQGTASQKEAGFTNCVFVTGKLDSAMADPTWVTIANCQTVSVEQVALDENFRPRLDESVAIDQGTLEGVNAGLLGEEDVYHGQRIYNAAIDVGAVEADWRPAYSAALGANVTVTNASPMVSLSSSDGRVTLADGASLKGVWRTIDASGEYAVRRSICASAADGTLAGEVGPYALSVTNESGTFARRDHGTDDLGFDFGYTGTGTGAIWNFMQSIAGFQLRFR